MPCAALESGQRRADANQDRRPAGVRGASRALESSYLWFSSRGHRAAYAPVATCSLTPEPTVLHQTMPAECITIILTCVNDVALMART